MQQKYYRWIQWLLICSLILIIGIGLVLGWFYTFYYRDVVQEVDFNNFHYQPAQKSLIYSADDVLLAEVYNENRINVDISQISTHMQRAIIAIEDHRFYKHKGVDILGTLRALVENLRYKEVKQGGSTITQQLARNLFLNPERTYERKLKEAALAIALERRYSKDEILSMYLNQIYYGSGYYGVEIAAQKYFGKPAAQLSLAESALLAAVPNRPSDYDLHRHPEAAQKRQQLVLQRMLELGMINRMEYQRALKEKVEILPPDQQAQQYYRYPYFVVAALKELEEILGHQKLYAGGLVIHTTLNTKIQQLAEQTVADSLDSFAARRISAGNVALVSVVPQTGAVVALVGGRDFQTDQNNLALTPRQPGSTIKPFVYAAALDSGKIKSNTLVNATPRSFNGYYITNGGRWQGSVALQDAISYSLNVPVAELVQKLGFEAVADYLKRFGISTVTPSDYNFAALALGGMYHGIKPLELAAAYGVFANGGEYHQPYFIEQVTDHRGQLVYQHQRQARRVISKEVADTMHYFLKGVVTRGTGTGARIAWESAGKTGTTDDNRCLWFVGYTNNLATAVWVGNNDHTPVYGAGSGGSVAGPIWRQYMTAVIDGQHIDPPAVTVFRPALGQSAPPSEEKPEEALEESEEEQPVEQQQDQQQDQQQPPDSAPDRPEEQQPMPETETNPWLPSPAPEH